MSSERSRLRRLLTARGDYWDLTWDLSQLERAWRNEIVTIPVRSTSIISSLLIISLFEQIRVRKREGTSIATMKLAINIGISFLNL